jgi:hypothetical protein
MPLHVDVADAPLYYQRAPNDPQAARACTREQFAHTFTHGEGAYGAYRATDRKEFLARLYHPETGADTSVMRDTRRAGRDPAQTRAFWDELEAYRARHFAEPNMYQTPMERMIAEDIKQMGPSVCIETEALKARNERRRLEDHARRKAREDLEDGMNKHDLQLREAELDARLRAAITEEEHLLQLKATSDARKLENAQQAEQALRHSLLLAPAMRGTRTVAAAETRLQELYDHPALIRDTTKALQRQRDPHSVLLTIPTAEPRLGLRSAEDIARYTRNF